MKLISIREYASLCGVSPQSIYKWIKNGLVKPIERRGTFIIDIDATPPLTRRRAGRPSVDTLLS